MSSNNDDFARRLKQLKGIDEHEKDGNQTDAALADRFAKLTGSAFVALQPSSSSLNLPFSKERVLCEDEMIDDILSQAKHEAELDVQTSHRLEASLEDRLARLKGTTVAPSPSSPSIVTIPTFAPNAGATTTSKSAEPSPSEFDWMSSDEDENDDNVLNRVIQSALDYSDEEEGN